MPIHHPGTVGGPSGFDPKHFFETVVLAALEARKEASERLGGSVEVSVGDAGAWRIDLDAGEVTSAGADADARMLLDAETLEALVRGKLDVSGAIAEGRLELAGDPGALSRLSIVLRP